MAIVGPLTTHSSGSGRAFV